MARSKRKHSRKGHHPSAKAKRAYYSNVKKAFSRLAKVVRKHDRNFYDHTVAD